LKLASDSESSDNDTETPAYRALVQMMRRKRPVKTHQKRILAQLLTTV
jgi:hypothetical protein